MATVTHLEARPFTFRLEYMGSAMMIKSVRPLTYTLLRLCNIAALVLQTSESPLVHHFHPKVILPWNGCMVDVNTDDMLKKIIQLCMIKGCNNVHILVLFSVHPTNGGNAQTPCKLLSTGDDAQRLTDSYCHSARRPAPQTAEQPLQATRQVVGVKRKYMCTLCKVEGHGKRTCKLVNRTGTLGPSMKKGGEHIDGPPCNGGPTIIGTVHRTTEHTP